MLIKKCMSMILLLFLTSSVLLFSASAAQKDLSITPVSSEKSNWCWSASAVMSGSYYYNYKTGSISTRTQSDVVQYVKGNTNNVGASIEETTTAMAYAAMNNSDCPCSYSNMTYAFSTIKGFLNQNKPIIAALSYGSEYTGHAVVIDAYRDGSSAIYDELWFIDPAYGYEVCYYYSEFCSNQSFVWTGIVYWS